MKPDVKRDQRNGWLVLAAAGLLCGGLVAWYSNDGGLEAKVASAASAHKGKLGRELMSDHVRKQQQANQILNDSINELKKSTNFVVSPFFVLTDAEKKNNPHESDFWLTHKFATVVDELDLRARDFSFKEWDEYQDIGFTEDPVQHDEDVAFNAVMLQLTYRAAIIAFSVSPGGVDHIHSLKIHHATKPVTVGPPGHPLIREYDLKVEVQAPIAQVMWILYRFSDTTAAEDLKKKQDDQPYDEGTYPLVLRNLDIAGDPRMLNEPDAPIDENLDEDATFEIAAMQYLDDSTPRPGAAALPTAPAVASPSSAPAGTGAMQPRF
jgi:hypothetical protein